MKSLSLALLLAVFATAQASPALDSTSLTPERAGHAATRLNSGLVLVTGGVNETATLSSALLYDPASGTFTPTGDMTTGRANHTSTLLNDGRVLITGGDLGTGLVSRTAEIYDPTTEKFTLLSKRMTISRSKHSANLLADGAVLLVGGKSADVYNPVTQTFTQTTNSPTNRSSHASVTLNDGTVLITGGYVGKLPASDAWIYDPANQIQPFTKLTGKMTVPRANHQTTLLLDGRVLVTGGFAGTSPHNEVDFYTPATGQFTSAQPMLNHRSNHQAVLLPSGAVLVVGGTTLETGFLAVNEIWDPTSGNWSVHDTMSEGRTGPTATMLLNGQILVAGGITGNMTLQSAEEIEPGTSTFTSLGNMQVARNQHTDTLLPDGRVLLAAGSTDAVWLNSAEAFDPGTNTFIPVGNLATARKSHTATLLQDNQVLITGGKTETADTKTAELFDPTSNQFTSTGSLIGARSLHTATLLNSGQVLVVGGRKGAKPLRTCELYDPTLGSFTSTGPLNTQRKRHRATIFNNGQVLVEGGASNSNGHTVDTGTPTAETYDAVSGMWTYTAPMHIGRTEHDATLLLDGTVLITGGLSNADSSDLYHPDTRNFTQPAGVLQPRQRHVAILLPPSWGSLGGQVLIIGGASTGNSVYGGLQRALDSVEIYDPVADQMTYFGTMTSARQNHTATLLPDGRILIAGGVDSPAVSDTAEIVVP